MKSIAVYCSSSNKINDEYKDEARKIGLLLAQKKIKIVYGGGNMGLMGILSNSALDSGGEVYGVITNHLIDIEKRNQITSEKFFERAKEQFYQGQLSRNDFRKAQIDLIISKNKLNQTLYNAKIAELNLYRLSGKIISKTEN